MPPSLSFTEAVVTCFRKYAVFSGRASRSEFWFFFLFSVIIGVIPVLSIYSLVIKLITFIPSLAVTTRRLHDTNRSGWQQLWFLTVIGLFIVWFWCAQKGDDHSNSYN